MSNSHFQASVWKEMITDTLQGNAIAATTYRNVETMIRRLMDTVLAVTGTNYYHSNKDIKEANSFICSIIKYIDKKNKNPKHTNEPFYHLTM